MAAARWVLPVPGGPALRQHGVEAFGVAPGGCRCSLVVVGELEGGEGAPQETVAHA